MQMPRVIFLIVVLGLVGCSGTPTSPSSTLATQNQLTPQTGVQGPAVPTATSAVPRPDSTTGSVVGVLVDNDGKPIDDIGVFVANLADGPQPGSKMITFQIGSSKRAITDADGRFVINGVAPGSYSLVIWTPTETLTIPPPGGDPGSAILVDVKAGQITDLGRLSSKRPT